MRMLRAFSLLLALALLACCLTAGAEGFSYQHDPMANPSAAKDIIVDPSAVYGYSPNPESTRLGAYAAYDWTDPEAVAAYREAREAYHASLDSMLETLREMRSEGSSIEEMARSVSAERNRLRLASYENDPDGLAKARKSNLETYGSEDGPTPESLHKKYGSWGCCRSPSLPIPAWTPAPACMTSTTPCMWSLD